MKRRVGQRFVVRIAVLRLRRHIVEIPLQGVVHVDADHGFAPHRLRVGHELVRADVVVLIAAPEIRIGRDAVPPDTRSPVVKRREAAARPADDPRGEIPPLLHRAFLEAADRVVRHERKIVADMDRVRRREKREGIAPLLLHGKLGTERRVFVPRLAEIADADRLLRHPFPIQGGAQTPAATEPLHQTGEAVFHAGKTILAVLREPALAAVVVCHAHGVRPVPVVRNEGDVHVRRRRILDHERGIVPYFLKPGGAGKREPGVVLVGGMIPVEHAPVRFTARAQVVFVFEEIEPPLVDQPVRVERLEAAVEKHLRRHAFRLQSVAELDEIRREFFADGRAVIRSRGVKLHFCLLLICFVG